MKDAKAPMSNSLITQIGICIPNGMETHVDVNLEEDTVQTIDVIPNCSHPKS